MKLQTFLKLSEEVSKDFSALMATAIMQKTIESLKTAEDTGVFKFVISTDDEDRQGEKVNQAGLDFTHYMKNPVVLWGHNYGEPPVGVATRIYRDGNKTMAEGKWAPTPFAQELRKLYDAGFLRACSIGYIPKELDEEGNTQKGEVLEFSIVSIPANPFALSADGMKQYQFDLNILTAKGVEFKLETEIKNTKAAIKAATVGDSCQLDDGTVGTMADDGNGSLICVPIANSDAKKADPKDPDADGDDDTSNGPNSDTAMDNLRDTLAGETPKHKTYTMDSVEEFKTFAKNNIKDADGKKGAQAKMMDKVDGEHGRHEKTVSKSIEEFCKSIEEFSSGKKAAGEKNEVPEPVAKAIAEFKSAVVDEHISHREKTVKPVEEYGKKVSGEDTIDKMDNYSAECEKALNAEHERHGQDMNNHIEKISKAIEEFKAGQKAAVATKEKMTVGQELEQTDEWKAKYAKMDRVYDIFYAFTSAYMDETTAVDDFEKLLDEAVSLMKSQGTEAKGLLKKHYVAKAGRKLSKSTLEAVKKALTEHENAMSAHEDAMDNLHTVHTSHKAVLAALKGFISEPNEGGDEDVSDGEKQATKVADAGTEQTQKTKVDKTSAVSAEQKDLESFLLNRDLLKSINKGITEALQKHNEVFGKDRPSSRK